MAPSITAPPSARSRSPLASPSSASQPSRAARRSTNCTSPLPSPQSATSPSHAAMWKTRWLRTRPANPRRGFFQRQIVLQAAPQASASLGQSAVWAALTGHISVTFHTGMLHLAHQAHAPRYPHHHQRRCVRAQHLPPRGHPPRCPHHHRLSRLRALHRPGPNCPPRHPHDHRTPRLPRVHLARYQARPPRRPPQEAHHMGGSKATRVQLYRLRWVQLCRNDSFSGSIQRAAWMDPSAQADSLVARGSGAVSGAQCQP